MSHRLWRSFDLGVPLGKAELIGGGMNRGPHYLSRRGKQVEPPQAKVFLLTKTLDLDA